MVAALVCVVTGVTCSFPTDKSDEVVVLIESAKTVVIRGTQVPLVARAFRVSGGDSVEIKNTSFQWASANASLATVQPGPGGAAEVTGVNSGTVDIAARAVAFEQAVSGFVQVRVSNPLEVDSVRPSVARFGDTITVYGVGVDSIFLASLDNTTLFDYPIPFLLPTRTRDEQGFGTAKFWVIPPARSSPLAYIGPGVFGEAPETTFVQPVDVLEPNTLAPHEIALDGPPRFPVIPQLLFYNPGLAFEALPRDVIGYDWYRFEQTAARSVTLVLGGPTVRGTFSTYVTDSLIVTPGDTTFDVGPGAWTIGPRSAACRGFGFEPEQVQPESTVVALYNHPAGVLHSLSAYTQPGGYSLRVQEGYLTTNPAIQRDAREEDDYCTAPEAEVVVTSIPNAVQWQDTLTIDNPQDIDWRRFHVTAQALGNRTVTVRVAPLVAGVDSSDIDLYVLTVPGGGAGGTLSERGRSVGAGSDESMNVSLPEGDYYAVVVDYVGRPVPYVICIEQKPPLLGQGCDSNFPAPPAQAGAAGTKSTGAVPRLSLGAPAASE